MILCFDLTFHMDIRIHNKGSREEDGHDTTQEPNEGLKRKPFYRYIKLILLTCCWFIFTVSLIREFLAEVIN